MDKSFTWWDMVCVKIMTANYSWAPAPVWFLFISPLLRLAGLGNKWFVWPHGQSKNPLRKSFWKHPGWPLPEEYNDGNQP